MAERDLIRGLQDAIEATPPAQPDLLGDAAAPPAEIEAGERRPGRPAGSANRLTVETQAENERLAKAYGVTPKEWLWALMVGVDQVNGRQVPQAKLEDRRQAAVALLPYTAKKLPVDVNVDARSLHVSLQLGEDDGPAGDGAFVIDGEYDDISRG